MHYGNGIALSEKLLDLVWQRQNITADNIANVDTPGYKRRQITFEDEIGRRLGGKDKTGEIGKAIKNVRGHRTSIRTESSRLDGNNVDMDLEQVELARTAIQYQYTINTLNNDFNRLRQAVKSF